MNILKDNLSGIASKKAYTAPAMEMLVMNPKKDLLLVCSPCGEDVTDNIGSSTLTILEE